MARIPQAEIERLKNEVSVERLIESSGIELKKAGKDRIGRCPFHADDTASLVVTPAKNLWHCFGCQIGGGPIDWVMKKQGVSFRHAVELLRDGVTVGAVTPLAAHAAHAADSLTAAVVKRSTVRALPAPVTREADDGVLMQQVVGYYHETLKQSPEALAYLAARGLNHPELIDTFQLGFANRTLGLRLPTKSRVAGVELRTRLQAIGIYRQSGHEHFNGSLVMPVMDEQGSIVEVYGRKIRDDLRLGTPKHLYLPEESRAGAGTRHGDGAGSSGIGGRGIWNVQALQASTEIILCEALIDAMTFWCAGYRNVTAAYGIEGFTDEHLTAFKRYNVARVLIAYDRDEPGERASAKLSDKLIAAGIECWRIQFPHGMDANEYALKVTPAVKSLGVAIRKAVWLGKGIAPVRDALVPEADAPVEAPTTKVANSSTGAPFEGNASKSRMDRPSSANAVTPSDTPPSLPSLAAAVPAVLPVALPASPMPSAPAVDTAAVVTDNEITMTFGDGASQRRYRVRGLAKNMSYELLKVNVMVSVGLAHSTDSGQAFHVDTIDLYSSKARASYVTQAAIELRANEETLRADLGRVLLKCEALQDEAIRRAMTPAVPVAVAISEADTAAALALLQSPDLLDRIVADFDACGIVGEATNKLVGYLAAVSRKLDRPLAVVIQSSSAAGKSSLMDAVLAFMPEEERIKYSAMTGQSLFYMGETNLKNKILAIVEEEGASKASYALKLLQSEGELTIASTGKDPTTGNLITQQYRVEGPVMIFLTTTAIEIDEELMNRCLVLSVDEGRAQTEAIHQLQRVRRTLQGLIARQDRQHLITLHRNAQRLIRPLAVVNPFADQLTFLSDKTRTRRDHEKYLTLIDTIALLHQHQRVIKTTSHQGQSIEYIEATLADIARANALAHEVLGRSLDELPPQTRRLLGEVVGLVRARAEAQGVRVGDVRFTRKDVRAHVGWSDFQVKTHMHKLEELEYVLVHRGGRGQSFEYELLYSGEGEDGKPFVMGLMDTTAFTPRVPQSFNYDGNKEHPKPQKEYPSRPQGDAKEHSGSNGKNAKTQALVRRFEHLPSDDSKTHVLTETGNVLSHAHSSLAAVAAAD
jgi:DNA primase